MSPLSPQALPPEPPRELSAGVSPVLTPGPGSCCPHSGMFHLYQGRDPPWAGQEEGALVLKRTEDTLGLQTLLVVEATVTSRACVRVGVCGCVFYW